MPIKPSNRHLYPSRADWRKIRERILERAEHRCECRGECGHHTERCELKHGTIATGERRDEWGHPNYYYVCLTIAHLDHDPTNNDETNLMAACQPCHLRYDAPRKKRDRLERANEGQLVLEVAAPQTPAGEFR